MPLFRYSDISVGNGEKRSSINSNESKEMLNAWLNYAYMRARTRAHNTHARRWRKTEMQAGFSLFKNLFSEYYSSVWSGEREERATVAAISIQLFSYFLSPSLYSAASFFVRSVVQ